MYCSKCGQFNNDNAKFCGNCGSKLLNTITPNINLRKETNIATNGSRNYIFVLLSYLSFICFAVCLGIYNVIKNYSIDSGDVIVFLLTSLISMYIFAVIDCIRSKQGIDMCILAVVFWIIWFIQALKDLFKHYIVVAILAVVVGDIMASLIGNAIGTNLIQSAIRASIYNYFN